MKNEKFNMDCAAYITGCSFAPKLTGNQQIDKSIYQEKINAAWIDDETAKGDRGENDIPSWCESFSKMHISNADMNFYLYNADSMFEACSLKEGQAYDQSLVKYQKDFYNYSTQSFLKTHYGL